MRFHSFEFLGLFLPIVVLLYWWMAAKLKSRWALCFLLASSLVFYAARYWPHLGVLAGSITVNYLLGRRILATGSRSLLGLGVAANLALLAFYKYSGFLLPFGISFFTFTQIAFLVDAAEREVSQLTPVTYALFVSFFPHSIAGPILHHRDMLEQFAWKATARWNEANFASGVIHFTIGLFKKVAIADTLAPWANSSFGPNGPGDFSDAWIGLITYALQLYFDFSGYCDMANGLAQLFNIRFPRNFDAPYQADSIVDFWRRWHITLSTFLRDYLLFRLPGNRVRATWMRNVFLTMLAGGIWHGAGWNFAIWGALHGSYLLANHWFRASKRTISPLAARCLTLLAVLIAWVPFRAETPQAAWQYWQALFGVTGTPLADSPGGAWQQIAIAVLGFAVLRLPTAERYLEHRVIGLRHALAAALIFFFCLLLMRESSLDLRPSDFIYFRF